MTPSKTTASFVVSLLALGVSGGSAFWAMRSAESAERQADLAARLAAVHLDVYSYMDPNANDPVLVIKIVNPASPITLTDLGFEMRANDSQHAMYLYWRPSKVKDMGLPLKLDRNESVEVRVQTGDIKSMTLFERTAVCGVLVVTSTGREFRSSDNRAVVEFVKSAK